MSRILGLIRVCFWRKWRNGEFDAKTMSEQLELEAENCSIECDGCMPKRWYMCHKILQFTTGFGSVL